jgi:Protein of unknown function (DUF3619)
VTPSLEHRNRNRIVETSNRRLTPAQAEALAARFALKLTARLDEGTQDLGHDIGERLRIARMQAVAAARAATVAQPVMAPTSPTASVSQPAWQTSSASAGSPGFGRDADHGRRLDDGPTGWGWRMASALPILALLAGLWGINWWHKHQQVEAAADIDMALLADDLPPSAYTDPGFEEFLRTSAPADAQDPVTLDLPEEPSEG